MNLYKFILFSSIESHKNLGLPLIPSISTGRDVIGFPHCSIAGTPISMTKITGTDLLFVFSQFDDKFASNSFGLINGLNKLYLKDKNHDQKLKKIH